MGGLDHGPATPSEPECELTAARNARIGLVLFVVYLALYVGFVLISAFRPDLLDLVPFAGVNLAVTYGLGLIGAAFLLALVYSWLCRSDVDREAHARKEAAR